MKALKNHHLPYNTLSGCLEAYFGDRSPTKSSNDWKYREPEQGFKTISFESLPLQLDYMSARRKGSSRRRLCRTETAHRFTQITNLFK